MLPRQVTCKCNLNRQAKNVAQAIDKHTCATPCSPKGHQQATASKENNTAICQIRQPRIQPMSHHGMIQRLHTLEYRHHSSPGAADYSRASIAGVAATDQLQTTKEWQRWREHRTMPKHTPARTYLQSAHCKTQVIPIAIAHSRHNPVRTTSFDTSIVFVVLCRAQYLIPKYLACQDIQ